ncbi:MULTISPECIES: YiaA/YiaB family inner membrane protein [Ensifer]|uniref:YiaA/YiaB family inner membrane protein n=1 Tax=Ensifer TaxID=106591 RepID=UPI0008074474|nr:YiaA/YiaB family inner membrane protein [Ensifer adhaerens]
MNDSLMKHSSAWTSFSYVSFGVAAFMVVIGLYMMPIDLWGKGYLAMGILMLLQTAVNVTKTLRDNLEAEKLIRRIDDAKTEKLLLGIKADDV